MLIFLAYAQTDLFKARIMSKLYSLIVGINDYPIQKLKKCVDDSRKIEDYLYSIEKEGFSVVEACRLHDKDATKLNIVTCLQNITSNLEDGDTFLFYFSGHGAREKSGERFLDDHNGVLECMVCYHDISQDSGFLLADKEIRYLLNQCKTKTHIVAIFDCCHSGGITRAFISEKRIKRFAQTFEPRNYDEFIFHSDRNVLESDFKEKKFNEVFPDSNIITLSACQSHEFSWEDGMGGIFTRNLLSVINGVGGIINYNDLLRRTEIAIRNNTLEKQTPTIEVCGYGEFNQLTSWLCLNGNKLELGAGYITYNNKRGWIYSKGKLFGVKKEDIITVRIENNEKIDVNLSEVKLNDSVVDIPNEISNYLNAKISYPVLFETNYGKPKIHFNNIDNDVEIGELVNEILYNQTVFHIVEKWQDCDYELVLFNHCAYYTFQNDPYRPLNQQINFLEDDEKDSKLDVSFLLEKLIKELGKIIGKWHHFRHLEKNDAFRTIPVKIEVKPNNSENWIDTTNGKAEFWPDSKNYMGESRKSYELKVTNVSSMRVFVTPLVLNHSKLEISSYNKSVVLEPECDFKFSAHIEINLYQEVYNWKQETSILKFIVTTETDLTTTIPYMKQKGFSEPYFRLARRGGGIGDDFVDSEEKWGVYTSEICLINPTENIITGELKEKSEWYANNDILAPFLQRLYTEVDEKSLNQSLALKRSSIYPEQEARSFKMFLGNTIDNARRKRLFKKMHKRYPTKDIVVAEGDSWFLYPILVKDTIDYLLEEWPIRSLAWAGDTLENYKKSGELLKMVKKLESKYVLISGGGNDIIGSEIQKLLRDNVKNPKKPKDYLNAEFDSQMKKIESIYSYFFAEFDKMNFVEKVIVHGYDYVRTDHAEIVTKNGWVNRYMIKKGIVDASERMKLMTYLIDSFNSMLLKLANKNAKVKYIDLRNIISNDEWYDEIHPNDIGYKKVANRFKELLN